MAISHLITYIHTCYILLLKYWLSNRRSTTGESSPHTYALPHSRQALAMWPRRDFFLPRQTGVGKAGLNNQKSINVWGFL